MNKLMSLLFVAVFGVFAGCSGNSATSATGSSNNEFIIAAEGTSITAGERQATAGYLSYLGDLGTWICNGVPGATSAYGLATLQSHLNRDNPNAVIFEYGANNDSSPAEDLRQMTELALNHNQVEFDRNRVNLNRVERVVITTISTVCGEDHDRQADRMREYNVKIRAMYLANYASDSRVRIADVEAAFDANGRCDLIGDGYHHPNEAGYRIMAETIRDQLL